MFTIHKVELYLVGINHESQLYSREICNKIEDIFQETDFFPRVANVITKEVEEEFDTSKWNNTNTPVKEYRKFFKWVK